LHGKQFYYFCGSRTRVNLGEEGELEVIGAGEAGNVKDVAEA